MKLRKILMGLAAVVGFTTAATAATANVVWEGDFGTTSKVGSDGLTYTLDLQDNTVNDGILEITSSTKGAKISPSSASQASVSVLIKYTDLEAISGAKPVIATAQGNYTYDIGLAGHTAGELGLNGFFNNDGTRYGIGQNSGSGLTETLATPVEGSGYFLFTYGKKDGTAGYAGAELNALVGNKSTKLKWDNTNPSCFCIGGPRETHSNYPAWTGLKIEKVAIFYGAVLTAADVANYQWPSEATLSKMYSNRLSTGGENVPGGTYGAITVPGDGYKATAFTALTTLSNTASGEEITGSYANIIKSGTQVVSHTVEGWFNVGELPTGDALKTIYLAKSCNSSDNGYKVVVNAEGKILVGKTNYDDGNYTWYGSPKSTVNAVLTEETAGNWFHLAVANAYTPSPSKVLTPTIFINGKVVDVESGTFPCNLNGNSCTDLMIGGGISAAGLYVDNDAIPYTRPDLVVEAATMYVAPYVAPTVYNTTINRNMTWSEIREVLLVDEEEFAENAQITLTMDGEHTITFDTTEALTGGLAFLKIVDGNCKFALADELYEDGCWSKTLFTAPLIEAENASGIVKDGFHGGWTFGPTEIAIRAQNKEVISINIAGGSSGDATGKASPPENLVTNAAVFYGIAPTAGDSWNNIDWQWQGADKTITIDNPKAYDGATTIQRPTMSLSATGKNTWQCGSITNPFLRGYLDDGSGVTVIVHGVPYTKYDVIVYVTSDSDLQLAPVAINGTNYTYVAGELVKGDTPWGVGKYPTPELGKNAIRINDCTGEQLTVSAAARQSGTQLPRGTFCAVQVINKGEVVVTTDYVGVMSGNVEWTDGAEDEHLESVGDPWVPGEYSTITITNKAADATFTFTQNTEGLKFKVVSDEGCALTIPAESMVEYGKLKTYDFTEALGGVTIELPEGEEFDPSTLPLIEGGNWKFSKTGTLVFDGAFPTVTEQTFFTNDVEWTGTVWLKNVLINDNNKLAMCCNSNATLKVTGVKGYMPSTGGVLNQGVANLVLEDDGDTLALEIDDSSSGYVYVYDKFTGDGTFKFATRAKSSCAVVITDVSEFMGKLLSTAGLHHDGKTATTPRPIFVGGTEGTAGTTSLISVADGAAINPDCGWEAESVAFGATLNVKTGGETATIVSGLKMEEPVYLATKVTYPESNVDFSCLGYEDDAILIRKAAEFSIDPGENATVTTVLGAFEDSGNYYAANEAPVQVTFTAKEGYLFPNGSTTLTVDAEAGEGATIEPTEEPVQAEAKIGTTYYLTLAAALDAAQADETVTLCKDITTAEKAAFTIDKSITLDFATFTVEKTVANDYTFDVTTNVTVTFTGTTGGVKQTQTAKNPNYPASMIRNKGDLTIAGGVYTSDFCIIKNDEDPGAGTLTVNGGTFNIVEPVQGFKDIQMALMNWSTATINGGTWNSGTICTRSCDGNKVSKAGTTEITAALEGTAKCLLLVGYPGDTTYENVPKIKGVDIVDVELKQVSTITDTLFLIEKDGYVTVAGNPEAKIGTTYYLTFAEALEAAKDDDTVTLLKDITTAETAAFTIDKSITLDFATFTVEKTVANDYTFDVTTNVTVTFTGTTGGVKQTQTAKNPNYPASMIRNKGDLTIEGGVYTSDFCIIKNDEDPGAGTLTVNGGTFNIVEPVQGFKDIQMALMNWSTATINGGTWNGGTICTRSCDGNKVSKAGTTEITTTLEGTAKCLLLVGYPGDTTYENVPKIKGVDIVDVELKQVSTITDELELAEKDGWITVQKKSGGTEVVPGEPVHCDTLLEAEKATVALDENQKTLDPEQQTEYTNLFTKVIIGTQETGYTVSFLPTEDTVTSVSNAVVEADKELLSEITPGESVEVSIETKPGLYYSVAVSETLSTEELVKGEGERIMGTGEPLELEVTTPEEATKCFYQIMVNVSDTKVGETK